MNTRWNLPCLDAEDDVVCQIALLPQGGAGWLRAHGSIVDDNAWRHTLAGLPAHLVLNTVAADAVEGSASGHQRDPRERGVAPRGLTKGCVKPAADATRAHEHHVRRRPSHAARGEVHHERGVRFDGAPQRTLPRTADAAS